MIPQIFIWTRGPITAMAHEVGVTLRWSPQYIWGKQLIVFPQHHTTILDVGLLLYERA
jgi:hypothetical protein